MKYIKVCWKQLEKMLYIILTKILHFNLSNRQWNNLLQFCKFSIIGLSNTIISYLIYSICLFLLQNWQYFNKIDYLIAQLFGFILSVLWSFYWNNKYVFGNKQISKRDTINSLLKTYLSYAFTGLFLNSLLSILWIEFFSISKLLAPLINLVISVPLNFIINKFWAFKGKGQINDEK